MSEKLYGYIVDEPKSEAIDDGLLFDLLLGGSALKASQQVVRFLNNAKRLKYINELKDKRKDWGIAYRNYSNDPEGAIEKLLEVQNGFVPNATKKYGGIDFVWGNNEINRNGRNVGYGLKHIKERRDSQGYNGIDFLKQIPESLNKGTKYFKEDHNGRFYVGDGIKENVIRTDFNGIPRQWLDSAYFLKK